MWVCRLKITVTNEDTQLRAESSQQMEPQSLTLSATAGRASSVYIPESLGSVRVCECVNKEAVLHYWELNTEPKTGRKETVQFK